MGKRGLPVSSQPSPSADKDVAAALGTLADLYFMMQRRTYDDPALTRYVARVGDRVALVANAGRFRFDVVDDTDVNAWSIPGGVVHVSRAALVAMESEAQLAAVLAHEVGHAIAGHAVQGFYASVLDPDVERADVALIDRDQEYQADRLGTRLLSAAGYDPRAAVQMLERLTASSGTQCAEGPSLETRIARMWRHVGAASSEMPTWIGSTVSCTARIRATVC